MKMLPKEYVDVRECQGRRDRNETNDCTVIAVSIALQVPYDEAHRQLSLGGRKHGDGFAIVHWLKGVGVSGYTLTTAHTGKVNPDPSAMLAYSRKRAYTYPTLAQVRRDFPRGRFILSTCDHALAMVDGKVLDFSSDRCRIKSVTYVEKI